MNFENDLIKLEDNNSWPKFLALLLGIKGINEGWLTFDKPKKGKRKTFPSSTKKIIQLLQGMRCRACGIYLDVCEFDHIDGNKANNDISNCQALCPNCHAKKTRKRALN